MRVNPPVRAELLEREAELATVLAALGNSERGSGQLVIVEGPAGIGKSRVLEEAADLAREGGHLVLRTRGGELETTHALGVVTRLVDRLSFEVGDEALAGALRGRAALAARVLGGTTALTGEATDEFALFDALYWLLANLAEEQPLVLIVDDVHWADDPSVLFVHFLAERLEDLAVTIIASARIGEPSADRPSVQHLLALCAPEDRLRPAELSLAAVESWLSAVYEPGAVSADLTRACRRASAGNPFLLEELIASFSVRDDEPDPNPDEIMRLAPDSVRRRVVLRVGNLGVAAAELTQACAVLGDDATVARVRHIAGIDSDTAIAAIGRLVAAQILKLDEGAVNFWHPMIRHAVYQGFDEGARARTHTAAACLLHAEGADSEVVCRHLLAGTLVGEKWALDALSLGAEVARRRGVPEAAVAYLRALLERVPPERWQSEHLVRLGSAEAATGHTTAPDRFEKAIVRATDPRRKAAALAALGETQFRYGRQADAVESFRLGAGLLADVDPDAALDLEAAYMCAALYVGNVHDEAMTRLETLVAAIGDRQDLRIGERVLLAVLAVHRAMIAPPAEDAAALARRAVSGGAFLSSPTSISLGTHLAAFALMACGHAREAQPIVAEALATAREQGDALAFAERSRSRAPCWPGRADRSPTQPPMRRRPSAARGAAGSAPGRWRTASSRRR